MLPSPQRPLRKLAVRAAGEHDDELDGLVSKELVRRPVVLGLREVDGAVTPAGQRLTRVAGGGGPLQESIDLKLRVWEDVREVEALG